MAIVPKLRLVGWSHDERYVQVMVDGVAHWLAVSGGEGRETVVWAGRTYRVGGCALIPV